MRCLRCSGVGRACVIAALFAIATVSAADQTGTAITVAGWRYCIRAGDTVRSVAARFKMPPQDLLRQLSRPFHAGQIIYVNPPHKGRAVAEPTQDWIDDCLVQQGDTLERIAARLMVSVQEIGDLNDLSVEVEVRAGDTVASLAKRFHTTPAHIADWNECLLNSEVFPGMKLIVGWEPVQPGEKLYYPVHSRAIEYVETELSRTNGHAADGSARLLNEEQHYETYTVRASDTIERIAGQRNNLASEIRDLNAMADDEQPKPGELLYVPKTQPHPPETSAPRRQLAVGRISVREGVLLRAVMIARRPGGAPAYRATRGVRLMIAGLWGNGYAVLIRGGYGWIDRASIRLGNVLEASRPNLPLQGDTDRLLKIAYTYLGVPYVWGGNTYRGIDCSGFVKNVFVAAGVWPPDAPRLGRDQMRVGVPVTPEQLQPGDRIYFYFGKNGPGIPDHTGIYIGGGQVMHAGCSRGVAVSCLFSGYLWRAFMAARRDVATTRIGRS